MRRNGCAGESSSSSSSSSSGWLTGLLSLAGGVGLGAGLLYLMDPDQGAKRRRRIMSGASGLASSARDYAGEGYNSLSSAIGNALSSAGGYASDKYASARDYAGEKLHNVGNFASSTTGGLSGYARDRMDDARAYAQRQVFGETHAEHRLHMTVCALSSMALGAALMYALDPQSGRMRRRQVVEGATDLYNNAGQYARQAGDAIKSGYNTAVKSTGDAVKSGYNTVSEKVGAVASSVTGKGNNQSGQGGQQGGTGGTGTQSRTSQGATI
jgi:ElaB/YqjD/DUF883 family membrane-anchored ribosome-binding protein